MRASRTKVKVARKVKARVSWVPAVSKGGFSDT